ncbi:MAG: GNAT family N-acetyltransferase [Candidatus Dormibacteria bacterium]
MAGHPLRVDNPRMPKLRVERCSGPVELLERVRPMLVRQPVRNSLILSILERRRLESLPGRYWVASRDGWEVGAAMQSPLHMPALLTAMPTGAATALADVVAGTDAAGIPGVIAEAATAAAFAGQWSEATGAAVTPEEGERLYRLARLALPPAPGGRLRPAGDEDVPVLLEWWLAFSSETGAEGEVQAEQAVARDLLSQRLFVWEDDGPRSMCRATPPVAGVSRIGAVYTPSQWRRRGYAAAAVASLCQRLQRQDGALPILYTQLANPTSNRIYRRLGFRAVAEVTRYRFGAPGPATGT